MTILRKVFTFAALLAAIMGICGRTALGKSPPQVPERDFILWGTAYVDGVALTRDDSGYTVSLRVNCEEIASYIMGSMPVDWYALVVPMSAGERQPGTAQSGDIANIYINGVIITEAYLEPAHQPVALPASIGNPAEVVRMSIYAQIAPAAIDDLAASTGANDGEVDLTWTATGDNGSLGTAAGYIVKYSQNPITNQAEFNSANTFPQSWIPKPSGEAESYTITNLVANENYYFSVEAVDGVPLQGHISNSPISAVAADRIPPYVTGHAPPPGSTAPIDTNISVEVRDTAAGVDQNTIQMTVEGDIVVPDITSIVDGYLLIYDPPDDFAYGQEVNVTVYADDLATPPNQMSEPHSYSFQIGDNVPPVASGLAITPSVPKTDDELTGSYTYSDAEGHPESGLTEIRWYRDGDEQTAWENILTVPSNATSRDEEWHFTVRPHDGYSYGSTQTSNPVVIGNTSPVAGDPVISPSSPFTDDDLVGTYSYSDIDNDPEAKSKIKWYMDGKLQSSWNDVSTVPASATSKGEEWQFTIRPGDGTDLGDIQTSSAVVIDNTRPVVSDAVISPSSPLTGDDLVANYVYSDADGDEEDGSTIRWYKNGNNLQPLYNDQTVVLSSATNKGENWRFVVRPGDGTVIGLFLSSPNVTIGNTPPVADAGGPYEVRSGEEILFDGSGSFDADGDLLTTYSWDFGDGNTGTGVSPTHIYLADSLYVVKLVVNDGTADSDASITTAYMGPEPGGSQQTAMELVAGWSLISIPTEPENTGPAAVLSSIQGKYDSIWGYDAVLKKWLVYAAGAEPFMNSLSEIIPGKGYWIKMNQHGILVFEGVQPVTAIMLQAGLNLVGYNSRSFSKPIEECMLSIAGKYNLVWTYDPYLDKWPRFAPNGPPSLNDLEFMQSGWGYWIDAKEECLWNIEP